MSSPGSQRAIVLGASSGIGEALAEQLAREGYDVALVARRGDRLEAICQRLREAGAPGHARAYVHDARDPAKVAALFARIAEELHGLDLVIYAAGVMPAIGTDEYDSEQDRAVIETNLTGAVAWLNEAARWFASAGAGSLVAISSIAGERGRRGYPAYGASKAGLNTYLESLRNRLAQHGVHVLTVKPGFVQTDMLRQRSGLFWVIQPDAAARQILGAVRARRHTVFVPSRWRLVAWAVRAIPSFLFRKLPI